MGGCVARPKELNHQSWEAPSRDSGDRDYVEDAKEVAKAACKQQQPPPQQQQQPQAQTQPQSRPLPGVGSRTATPTKRHEIVNKSLASLSNASSRTSSPQHIVHSPEPRRTSLPPRSAPATAVCLEDVALQDSPCRRNGTPVPVVLPNARAAQQQSAKPYQQQKYTLVVAMFDYVARTEGEVTFQCGDTMTLVNPIDSDWWYVEHKKSKACGYIPVALVAVQNSLESMSWFFGQLPRKEAERQLLMSDNCRGTFLVRESETHRESYSLSVLDYDSRQCRDTVKHYRIRMLDNAAGCYITSRQKFASMQALVDNYSQRCDGLCCKLARPCRRPLPTIADLSYQTKDQWEIPREQIHLVQLLGSGQFGEVWRGTFNGKLEVAVKMLKAGSMSRQDFLKEARIMKRLRHPKLVQLFAVCTDSDPVYIVTELMAHGSLLNYLRDRQLELSVLVDILGQIASGMAYLEAEKFVHRDLAARNILVGDSNAVKVADFGLSRAITDTGEYTAKEGATFPIKWTSPEAALLGRFSVKSDIWSFGIVSFEVITHGQVPYPGMSNTETLDAVETGYRLPKPQECPDALYQVMLSCWHAQPELRPTFIFLREFFDDFFPASEPSYRLTGLESAQQTPQHQPAA